ncbi:hypothetical protein SPRG_01540 [Saprolegnia parasitica CBS 223.65]|uniref:AB hydrolase-1 domain-containing protein n=1 Tax=Saprolegnia parasitica (strain CBS 223.65) TaxID=695850 RepID=A0A067CUL2_SAPPC|nr:hypothetical protein SPRG_01540 [Saprolegnia parasitica CBS 223.65]KDO34404.1 hypothetical protein SPRG_01540 [Saprolegnia parasitica CBS 223.65]|eukprot:XP_012195139.1 hypothetical protein SPRG_01540 [Saprolegnia parasitica CBS 223.65]
MATVHSSALAKLPGGVHSRDHRITVPLDHFDAGNHETIEVYVREVVADKHLANDHLPLLLYLQGGPGFPSPRPGAPPSGWLKKALEDYRVLLLDQRGTGLSTPITAQSVRDFKDPDALAAYLRHFRADAIVHDAELFRSSVFPDLNLTLLGQSFGGFCILSYLSFFPGSLDRVLFTVGLAPVGASADSVYEATYAKMVERNRRFYARYPEDTWRVAKIAHHLKHHPAALPGGGVLTARRFATLGAQFGFAGGMETVHYLLEGAWLNEDELSSTFLAGVERLQAGFDTNPLYFVLHEAIYCDGPKVASNWAAQRVHAAGDKRFHWDRFGTITTDMDPLYFSGEMVFPWMAEDYAGLRVFQAAAEKLAATSSWRPLYDLDALKDTEIPGAALIAYDDVFVDRDLSLATARLLGDNIAVFVTNEYQHSGLRDEPALFEKLLKASKGELVLPS